METPLDRIISRQRAIADGDFNSTNIDIPTFSTYAVCNLRGGVGKTTLTFNLSYYSEDLLVIDVCPQGNLSYFYDHGYDQCGTNIYQALTPYFLPNMRHASNIAAYVGATNEYFDNKRVYYIPSSNELYLAPTMLNHALQGTINLPPRDQSDAVASIMFSLKSEIEREMKDNKLNKCLIDTSPFFAGGTELAWYATDALIVPVRTDRQSINSFELLVRTLTEPSRGFLKYEKTIDGFRRPKIHAVVLTHCGWSTRPGARYVPNQQTKVYLQQCYEIMSRNRSILSTENPEDHLFLLDDFLGSGRISSYESEPIELLQAGESKTLNRVRVTVNAAVEKCKKELRYIHSLLWK